MDIKVPRVGIEILVIRENKILLGLLTKKWMVDGIQVYGVPGRDLNFQEKIGVCIERNIKDELNCTCTSYKIISVNTNYAWDNHYVNIGATAEIIGDITLMKLEDWESWEWFDLNSLPDNLFPSAKHTIESYRTSSFCVSE
jgi:8-oxo-dGTP diphosphatase